MPFLIDSVVAPTAAQLLKGDEIVAIESRRTADRYEKMDTATTKPICNSMPATRCG